MKSRSINPCQNCGSVEKYGHGQCKPCAVAKKKKVVKYAAKRLKGAALPNSINVFALAEYKPDMWDAPR